MDATVEQLEMLEFPVIAENSGKRSFLRQYIDATREHGPLATQGQIAGAMGVSRQRIHELVNAGRIASVRVGELRYVPCSAYELFLTEERRVGRPLHDPKFFDIVRGSWKHGK